MTRRSIRTARKQAPKRQPVKSDDFDVLLQHEDCDDGFCVECSVSAPMTPEQEAQFGEQYQRDAIAENTGPQIPDRY